MTARPESEHIRVEVPGLRIVEDELWDAAHRRMKATRRTYLRGTDGKLWGRPPTGTAAKHLLVGMAICAKCGAGLEIRSRSHGKKRAKFYACSARWRKGEAVCGNEMHMPMRTADQAVIDAVLNDILTPQRLVEVTRKAVKMAREKVESDSGDRGRIEGELRDAEKSLGRLCAVIEAGGEAEVFVGRINALETRREALSARLEALDRPVPEIDENVEEKIAQATEEWREVLGRQVPVARQILGRLLREKITFTPEERQGRDGFKFSAVGTVRPLLEGAVPSVHGVMTLTGFEPVLPA